MFYGTPNKNKGDEVMNNAKMLLIIKLLEVKRKAINDFRIRRSADNWNERYLKTLTDEYYNFISEINIQIKELKKEEATK